MNLSVINYNRVFVFKLEKKNCEEYRIYLKYVFIHENKLNKFFMRFRANSCLSIST